MPEDESTLIASMENPNSPAPAPGGGFAFLGFDVIDIFADTPEQQTPTLFPGLNLTGTTDADLVTFSNAASGGSLEVSIQPAGQAEVPEPVSSWLLGVAVFAVGPDAPVWLENYSAIPIAPRYPFAVEKLEQGNCVFARDAGPILEFRYRELLAFPFR